MCDFRIEGFLTSQHETHQKARRYHVRFLKSYRNGIEKLELRRLRNGHKESNAGDIETEKIEKKTNDSSIFKSFKFQIKASCTACVCIKCVVNHIKCFLQVTVWAQILGNTAEKMATERPAGDTNPSSDIDSKMNPSPMEPQSKDLPDDKCDFTADELLSGVGDSPLESETRLQEPGITPEKTLRLVCYLQFKILEELRGLRGDVADLAKSNPMPDRSRTWSGLDGTAFNLKDLKLGFLLTALSNR